MNEQTDPAAILRRTLHDFLWSREFYELMQTYRHTPVARPQNTVDAFEAVKSAISSAANLLAPLPVVPREEPAMRVEVEYEDGQYVACYARDFTEHPKGREGGSGDYSPTLVGALANLCATLIKVDEDTARERLMAGDTPPPDRWQPIETAPERRKVFVTWVNALGKRRTAFASYWPEGTLEMADDVPDYQITEEGKNLDAGWWEESEGNEDAMFRLVEKMTHWQEAPAPPEEQ